VAGSGRAGALPGELYHPLGLWILNGDLVVADSLGYRVQRWGLRPPGREPGEMPPVATVAGGRGCGAGPQQLGQPMSVVLDGDLGLLVADPDNDRVQLYRHDDLMRNATAMRRVTPPYLPTEEERERRCGRCAEWARGGYGFVMGDDGVRYFAHHSDVAEAHVQHGYPGLKKGERVEFEVRRDPKWKWRCTDLTGPGSTPIRGESR